MTSEKGIENTIESLVNIYPVWTIGVTNDLARRKSEHGNPRYWYHWDADSEQIARDVEAYFVEKGMKGATGGGARANYVYIFLP